MRHIVARIRISWLRSGSLFLRFQNSTKNEAHCNEDPDFVATIRLILPTIPEFWQEYGASWRGSRLGSYDPPHSSENSGIVGRVPPVLSNCRDFVRADRHLSANADKNSLPSREFLISHWKIVFGSVRPAWYGCCRSCFVKKTSLPKVRRGCPRAARAGAVCSKSARSALLVHAPAQAHRLVRSVSRPSIR
jgi:hypothetical protein